MMISENIDVSSGGDYNEDYILIIVMMIVIDRSID